MNAPKCSECDYINFLVAAQQVFSTVEAARSHPDGERKVAHDAYTRLLQRLPPDSEALWAEVQRCIALNSGLLIIDDTTLDKPYVSQMALVSRHWSGKHHEVVQGIITSLALCGAMGMPVCPATTACTTKGRGWGFIIQLAVIRWNNAHPSYHPVYNFQPVTTSST
jgi:hypothetical protein